MKKKEKKKREVVDGGGKIKKAGRSVMVHFSLCPLGGAPNTFHASFKASSSSHDDIVSSCKCPYSAARRMRKRRRSRVKVKAPFYLAFHSSLKDKKV